MCQTLVAVADRLWVADTTFFWGTSAVGLLDDALDLADGRLCATPAVRAELARNAMARPFLQVAEMAFDSGRVAVAELTIEELRTVFDLRALWQKSPRDSGDLGEAEVIAIARHRQYNVVLDDAQARRTLQMRYPDLECVDTPQVVLQLIDAGRFDLTKGWELLVRMHEDGGFAHCFAGRRKSEWMSRRDYPRMVRF